MSDDEWANRLRFTFAGVGKPQMNLLKKTVGDVFADAGFEVVWEVIYPTVTYADVRAAIRDADLSQNDASWIRQFPSDQLESVLSATRDSQPAVRGYGVAVEPADHRRALDTVSSFPMPSSLTYTFATGPDDHSHVTETTDADTPVRYDPVDDYTADQTDDTTS